MQRFSEIGISGVDVVEGRLGAPGGRCCRPGCGVLAGR